MLASEPTAPAELEREVGQPGPTTGRTGWRPTLSQSVAMVLVVLGFVIGARPISDNSTLTHLATGRLILDQWSVPEVDPYSFTATGHPWVVQSWLASAFYAGLEQLLGLWAVRVVHGLLAAGLVAITWALVRGVPSLFVRVALAGTVVGIGTMLWPPRPLLFGLVGLGLVLLVLDGRISVRWLVAVFGLWAAAHGSFPLGLAVITATGAGAWLDDRRLPRREVSALLWASLGALASVAGPLGVDGLLFPLQLLQRGEALGVVAEWKPPTWDTPVELLYAGLVVAAVLVLARRGATWRCLLPAVLAVVLSLMAVRNLSVSSLVLVAAMAPALAGVGRRAGIDPDERGVMALGLGAAAAVVGVVALVSIGRAAPMDLERYPLDELAWLEQRDLVAAPDVRLISRDVVGNYLELRFGADAHVFIDDRVDMYPTDVVRDYVTLLHGGDQQAVLDRWQPDVVLWDADGQLRYWLEASPAWDLVNEGDEHVVFCRADSPVRARCL